MGKDSRGRDCTVVLLTVALVGAIAALVPLAFLRLTQAPAGPCQCPLIQPTQPPLPSEDPRTATPEFPTDSPTESPTPEPTEAGSTVGSAVRVKRSVLDGSASLAVQQPICPAHMTGFYCQSPVCPARIPIAKPINGLAGFGVTVDIQVRKGQACMKQSSTFPVDSTMISIAILMDSEKNTNPSVVLINPAGTAVSPSSVFDNSSNSKAFQYTAMVTGIWTVHFSSPQGCVVFVLAQTPLTINEGILYGKNAIIGDNPQRALPENVPSYFVAHANNLACPGAISFLEVYEQTLLVFSKSANMRYNCSYEAFFGLIDCTYQNSYYYKLFGRDAQGFQFMRTNTIICTNEAPTTPAPLTSPQPGTCDNGGTFVSQGICVCPPYFGGQYCQNFLCLHGGTYQATPSPQCLCSIGYTGTHCQTVQCTTHNPYNFNVVKRSIAFVFNARASMENDWVQLIQTVPNAISTFQTKHPGAIINYVLTTFRDSNITTTSYNTSKAFLGAFGKLGGTISQQPSENCSQPVLTALSQTIKYVVPRSPIFIFTDALPSDYDLGTQEMLMHQDSFFVSEFYFHVTNRTGHGGMSCPPINSIYNTAYVAYQNVAKFSAGQVLLLPKGQVSKVFAQILSSQYGTDVLLTADYYACSNQPSYTTVLVDTSITALYIYGNGPPSAHVTQSLRVTPPNGNNTLVAPTLTMVGNTYMWIIQNPTPGIYQFTYATSVPKMPCSLRVRGATKLIMFYAVTPNVNTDKSSPMPTYKQPGNMVVHVNGLSIPSASLFGGELAIKSPGGVTKFLSSGQYRQRCDYQIFFAPYNCTVYGQLFYLTFYGTDNNGVAFQRTRPGFCSPSKVTPSPPSGCQNGGAKPSPSSPICVCPPYWNGTYCSKAICANGGISLGQSCECAPGFSGPHCTQISCFNKNTNVLTTPGNRSLAFVVQNTVSMAQEITQIISQIDYTINQANQASSQWFARYVLVVFGDTTNQLVIQTSSQTQFVTAVKALKASAASTTCNRNVLAATLQAMQWGLPYGQIFVFTDGGASDYHQTAPLYGALEGTKAAVTFVVTSTNPCNSSFMTPETQSYESLAQYSDGQFFAVKKTIVGEILRYIPTLYSSGMVHATNSPTCTTAKPLNIFFPIESSATGFTLAVTGYQAAVTIKDPTGNIYKYAAPMTNGSYVTIMHAYKRSGTIGNTFIPGIWSASITTQKGGDSGLAGCKTWVRAQSPVQVFYGFLQATPYPPQPVHSDFPTKEPEVSRGLINYMIAHVDGIATTPGHHGGHLGYMNNFADANGALINSARFNRRGNCGYEYISQPFICPNLFYTVVLSGFDPMGYAFNRLRVAICIPVAPVVSTTPPPLVCMNGGYYNAPTRTCICPSWWGGQVCTKAICANGGTPAGGICQCPVNFGGFHCTVSQCGSRTPTGQIHGKSLIPQKDFAAANPETGPNHRSMAWVVQNTVSMSSDVAQLQQEVDYVISQATQANASWITQWILVTFDNTNVTKLVVNTSDPTKFSAAVKSLKPYLIIPSGKCPKYALHGLYQALTVPITFTTTLSGYSPIWCRLFSCQVATATCTPSRIPVPQTLASNSRFSPHWKLPKHL